MSSTVFFKQWYKPRADPSTPGLNVRHLQYIATRPGAVYNPGCGFGLWGQLPGDSSMQVQNDLDKAKRIVREASKNHTLYRAIFSVGKKDAQEHGLYRRERWERLVGDHVQDIAKEMDIKPENMCWCASFHYAKGHPHVHILYWDKSDEPRQEYVPKPLWDAKAEHIRAAFAGDIHREEIREAQKEQRGQIKHLRTAILAMCREANPEKALNLPTLYNSAALKGLSQQLADLIQDIPARGSLRYAYLPPDYKAKVDALVDGCLKVPELAAELDKYDRCTRQISLLYANGESGGDQSFKNARDKLRKEFGNQVMIAIREIRDELQFVHPENQSAAQALVQEATHQIAPTLKSYQNLKSLLPRERIPLRCMEGQIPGYHEQLNRVVGDVLSDARVRLRLQGYALAAAGIDITQKPYAPRLKKPEADKLSENNEPPEADKLPQAHEQPEDDKLPGVDNPHRNVHTVWDKELSQEEWDAYQAVYRQTKRELRAAITQQARLDVGWTEEAVTTATMHLLIDMMRAASQAAYQRQAGAVQARNGLKTRSKDKSREAKRDYSKTQEYGGGQWSDGYG